MRPSVRANARALPARRPRFGGAFLCTMLFAFARKWSAPTPRFSAAGAAREYYGSLRQPGRHLPEYHPIYYGAFVLDPDGHNIEAVCHEPAPSSADRVPVVLKQSQGTRRSGPSRGTIHVVMTTDAATIDRAGLAERERVLALLRAKEAELRALGVTRLRLFGSIARGEAGPESDVDLLAEIDHSAKFSLIDHVGLEFELGDLLNRRVDISTAPWKLRPRMRRRVERDAIEVF